MTNTTAGEMDQMETMRAANLAKKRALKYGRLYRFWNVERRRLEAKVRQVAHGNRP